MNYTNIANQPTNNSTLQNLEERFRDAFGDELWTALRAGIGVICALALKDRSHPVVLIYEGPSGRGKSTCINVLEPDREATRNVLYRLDNFTAKAFVSHVANIPRENMAEIDLLPKVKDKALLVKELAPVFRGSDSELRDRFSNLTSVLDGKGFVTASGVHGTRGYEGRYVFNWLGGTTPIPSATDAVMAQLGNRMLRYEISGREFTEEEMLEIAMGFQSQNEEGNCRHLANDYVEQFFAKYPVSSVEQSEIEIPKGLLLMLVRCARLTAQGRVEIVWQDNPSSGQEELVVGSPEGPIRLIYILRQIAQGLALAEGRRVVNYGDMEIVRHVAISSIPRSRRSVLKAVIENDGSITSAELEKRLPVSRPTARHRMRELSATGIVVLRNGAGNDADEVTLAKEWIWLKVGMATPIEPPDDDLKAAQ